MLDSEDKKYNFHSHTFRCGHASNLPDSTYLNVALNNNYNKYGITDHAPVHPIFYGDSKMRMNDSERYEYINAINNLKVMYAKELEVFCGFEAEYDEIIEEYLCDLRDSVDYMILGQHYVLNRDIRKSPNYPIEYAKKVCKGIESGLFDIVAHPDIFMKFRTSLKDDDSRETFMKNAYLASKMICAKAKEYNVPLELNLGGVHIFPRKRIESLDIALPTDFFQDDDDMDYIDYPTNLFWNIAIEMGNSAVVGIDAHFPNEIEDREEKLERINRYIDLSKINFLPNSYDPVKARLNNPKLEEAYQKTKDSLNSVEARLIDDIVSKSLESDKEVKRHSLATQISRSLKSPTHIRAVPFGNGFLTQDQIYDDMTKRNRDELAIVARNGIMRTKSRDSDIFRTELLNEIDAYYRHQEVVNKEIKKNK